MLCDEGMRIEPQVSLPHPTAAKLAAMAAPVPPLEPPGFRTRSYGFSVWPPSDAIVLIPAASSCRLDLPMNTAPASRSFLTWKASSGGMRPARPRLAADEGMPVRS